MKKSKIFIIPSLFYRTYEVKSPKKERNLILIAGFSLRDRCFRSLCVSIIPGQNKEQISSTELPKLRNGETLKNQLVLWRIGKEKTLIR